MAVEFSPLGSIPSVRAGLEVVDLAGPTAALMIDTWHFFFGDTAWADLEAVPVEKIAYIQFDDGLEPVSEDLMGETMERRVLPGTGIFDLERFAATLLESGIPGGCERRSAQPRTAPAASAGVSGSGLRRHRGLLEVSREDHQGWRVTLPRTRCRRR